MSTNLKVGKVKGHLKLYAFIKSGTDISLLFSMQHILFIYTHSVMQQAYNCRGSTTAAVSFTITMNAELML